MKRFRIKKEDTVSAQAVSERGKLLAPLYDSGFTTIAQVESALLRKIPYYGGKKLEIRILNNDEQTYKTYDKNVNK